ncbi:nitronate monooxygenase [Spirosoma sp. SC4-14]|uniref:NAD(P)H-dependent flavin oxidoreductase n=1 Tax=Spirosoma sp. SC4-14 TaxID=3128900 RepID=UPI0030D05D22
MNWNNELTNLLSIKYPIVQAPMLGVTTPAMVAAVANRGGLGSLPVGGLSPQQTSDLIRQTKGLTSKPFAVNLFAHDIPSIDVAEAEAMQVYLSDFCYTHQLPYEPVDLKTLRFYAYQEQIEVLIREQIPVVSFTFGIIDDESMARLKAAGSRLIANATSVAEAQFMSEKNIDAITIQGIEAGGHRGSFLATDSLPMVGLMALLPQVASQVRKPLLAAGGIYNGTTIKAAMMLGASGVQIGTAFIASPESKAIAAYKDRILRATETDTRLTRSFSGRWARGIINTFMESVDRSGLAIPAYPIQNSITTQLRAVAQSQNNAEFTNMWAGQSASTTKAKPTGEIFDELIAETERLQMD